MDNLVFLQCVSHHPFFMWQTQVQIVNFRKFGISDKMQVVVWWNTNNRYLQKWHDIERQFPEVKFFYYEDTGVDLSLYIPQLRPHALKKHFIKYKDELRDKIFFYHDADIIFNRLPDFGKLVEGPICWQSNCSSYLDYNYLQKKELEGGIKDNLAIKKLASIGGIVPDMIKSYAGRTGGAQCILKNIDHTFWEDVENQVLAIRKAFFYNIPGSINSKYFESENKGFQSWCADMWALNFSLWKRDIVTDTTKDLDFSWATDDYETFLMKPIFHNAGATEKTTHLFFKGEYRNKSPFTHPIILPSEKTASRAYVEAILEAKVALKI